MEELKKKFHLARGALICSFVIDAVGIAALILQWRGTVPIIIFAFLFYLAAVGITKRQYNKAWYEKNTIKLAEKQMQEISYTPKEIKEGNALISLGFVPELSFIARDQFYHVLRGKLKGLQTTAAETAFVRRYKTESRSIGGTLVSTEGILAPEESWVILWQHPLDGITAHMEYEENGWTVEETPEVLSDFPAECMTRGEKQDYMEKAAVVLSVYCKNMSAAVAAENGKLSLLLPSVFYAQKPDPLRQPAEEDLERGSITGLEIMEKLCDSILESQGKSTGKNSRKA